MGAGQPLSVRKGILYPSLSPWGGAEPPTINGGCFSLPSKTAPPLTPLQTQPQVRVPEELGMEGNVLGLGGYRSWECRVWGSQNITP